MKQFKRKENGVQLPFNDETFIEKWAEWLQYRSERRIAKYTPTGLKRTFSKLLEDSNANMITAVAIIDQSLALSYQGLFPLKNAINGTYQQNNTANSGTPTKLGTSAARIEAAKKW